MRTTSHSVVRRVQSENVVTAERKTEGGFQQSNNVQRGPLTVFRCKTLSRDLGDLPCIFSSNATLPMRVRVVFVISRDCA